MKRERDPGPDTDIITFTVVVEKSNPGRWEASVQTRPALSYMHSTPYKAVKKLLKMMDEEGIFDV